MNFIIICRRTSVLRISEFAGRILRQLVWDSVCCFPAPEWNLLRPVNSGPRGSEILEFLPADLLPVVNTGLRVFAVERLERSFPVDSTFDRAAFLAFEECHLDHLVIRWPVCWPAPGAAYNEGNSEYYPYPCVIFFIHRYLSPAACNTKAVKGIPVQRIWDYSYLRD